MRSSGERQVELFVTLLSGSETVLNVLSHHPMVAREDLRRSAEGWTGDTRTTKPAGAETRGPRLPGWRACPGSRKARNTWPQPRGRRWPKRRAPLARHRRLRRVRPQPASLHRWHWRRSHAPWQRSWAAGYCCSSKEVRSSRVPPGAPRGALSLRGSSCPSSSPWSARAASSPRTSWTTPWRQTARSSR